MIQKVTFNLQDGNLGVVPPGGADLLCHVGPASSGTTNAVVQRSRDKDVSDANGVGPLVEAACYGLKNYGNIVGVCRSAAGNAGANSAITDSTGGTSVIAEDAAVTPRMDCDVVLLFVDGGTRGTAGITYRYSLDGERTWIPSKTGKIALGTATSITLSEVNSKVDLGVGTISAARKLTWRTTAPTPTSNELDAALLAIEENSAYFPLLHVASPVDATLAATLSARLASMEAKGRPCRAIVNARRPLLTGETEAQYLAALKAIFTSADRRLGIAAGWQKTLSAVSQRVYKLPRSFAVAPLVQSRDWHEDVSQKTAAFAMKGVTLRGTNGERDDLDESIDPGFDDAHFITAETRDDRLGSYIVNPNLYSPDGSDYEYIQHGRLMDAFCRLVRRLLGDRLSREIFVNAKTGFILESEAADLDVAILGEARTVFAGKVSDIGFAVSRTDNLLSTKTVTASGVIVPPAYPKAFAVSFAFNNPALRVQQV